MKNPFRYFNSSPKIIRLTVIMYIRYPLSLRQVEDLLFERGIDICHETVRVWWNRFRPMFAAGIRKRRVQHRCYSQWQWHLDEMFVRINGKVSYLRRAVDQQGEVPEIFASKRPNRNRKAALAFLTRAKKRYGQPWSVVTDRLPFYGAAMKVIRT
jgi:putative transposase